MLEGAASSRDLVQECGVDGVCAGLADRYDVGEADASFLRGDVREVGVFAVGVEAFHLHTVADAGVTDAFERLKVDFVSVEDVM